MLEDAEVRHKSDVFAPGPVGKVDDLPSVADGALLFVEIEGTYFLGWSVLVV